MSDVYTIHMQQITSIDQGEPAETGVVETNDLGALVSMIQCSPYHLILFSRTDPRDLIFMSLPSLVHVMAVWAMYEARNHEEDQEALTRGAGALESAEGQRGRGVR